MGRGMWILEQYHASVMREAAELLSQRGYDNVWAEDLAQVAQVSVGTLYRRYGDKHHFARAVRDFAEEDLCSVARNTFERALQGASASFHMAFLALWWELASWATVQPGLFGFAFLHWHPRSPDDARPPGEKVRALVREVLGRGVREGMLAPGPARVGVALLWGTLTELVRVATWAGRPVKDAEVLAAGETLWQALRRAEEASPP